LVKSTIGLVTIQLHDRSVNSDNLWTAESLQTKAHIWNTLSKNTLNALNTTVRSLSHFGQFVDGRIVDTFWANMEAIEPHNRIRFHRSVAGMCYHTAARNGRPHRQCCATVRAEQTATVRATVRADRHTVILPAPLVTADTTNQTSPSPSRAAAWPRARRTSSIRSFG